MDLGFSAEEVAFRAEVREFVAKNLPASISPAAITRPRTTS